MAAQVDAVVAAHRPAAAGAAGEGVRPGVLRALHDPPPATRESPAADVLRAVLVKDPADRPTAAQAAARRRLHDGTRYPYPDDASVQIWKDRGFRVEGQF